MKETGLTGKRRSTTIAATPDDGKSQRKRRRRRRKCSCMKCDPLFVGHVLGQLYCSEIVLMALQPITQNGESSMRRHSDA